MIQPQKSAKQIEDESKPAKKVIQEVVKVESVKEKEVFIEGQLLKKLSDSTPSNWTLIPDESEIVVATCSNGEVFRGTIAEFNKALRAC